MGNESLLAARSFTFGVRLAHFCLQLHLWRATDPLLPAASPLA